MASKSDRPPSPVDQARSALMELNRMEKDHIARVVDHYLQTCPAPLVPAPASACQESESTLCFPTNEEGKMLCIEVALCPQADGTSVTNVFVQLHVNGLMCRCTIAGDDKTMKQTEELLIALLCNNGFHSTNNGAKDACSKAIKGLLRASQRQAKTKSKKRKRGSTSASARKATKTPDGASKTSTAATDDHTRDTLRKSSPARRPTEFVW